MNHNYSYAYLKKYIGRKSINGNWFVPVKELDIVEAESRLNEKFPSELRKFYQEVGTGFLAGGSRPSETKVFTLSNHILSPRQLADLMLLGSESGLIVPGAWECMIPGDLPFFEICDRESFLVMKPQSKKPNAVYDEGGLLIEESFEKFVWRLYYESPSFYEDIIQEDVKRRRNLE